MAAGMRRPHSVRGSAAQRIGLAVTRLTAGDRTEAKAPRPDHTARSSRVAALRLSPDLILFIGREPAGRAPTSRRLSSGEDRPRYGPATPSRALASGRQRCQGDDSSEPLICPKGGTSVLTRILVTIGLVLAAAACGPSATPSPSVAPPPTLAPASESPGASPSGSPGASPSAAESPSASSSP
jgi:hypothetical protein